MSTGIIALLISLLEWPVIAEIVTASALFIHSLLLARNAKDLFLTASQKGLVTEWLLRLQHSFEMKSHNSESEV